MIMLVMLSLAVCACGSSQPGNSATSDVRAENFWAGLATVTIERGLENGDVCSSGRLITQSGVIEYDGWARERAEYTSICFQIWKPGVTDQNSADYAQKLDVRAIWRASNSNPQTTEYVNSVDRQGNNRRYEFDIRHLDPIAHDYSANPATHATIELVFAIKDTATDKEYVLKSDSGSPFTINFSR
jgi:hypothetical protein